VNLKESNLEPRLEINYVIKKRTNNLIQMQGILLFC